MEKSPCLTITVRALGTSIAIWGWDYWKFVYVTMGNNCQKSAPAASESLSSLWENTVLPTAQLRFCFIFSSSSFNREQSWQPTPFLYWLGETKAAFPHSCLGPSLPLTPTVNCSIVSSYICPAKALWWCSTLKKIHSFDNGVLIYYLIRCH